MKVPNLVCNDPVGLVPRILSSERVIKLLTVERYLSEEQEDFLERYYVAPYDSSFRSVEERSRRWDVVLPGEGSSSLPRVDVYGEMKIYRYAGSRLPLRFGRILGGHFYLMECPNLVSLDGAPLGATGDMVEDCPRVPSHHFQILKDSEWRHAWWSSGLSMDQWWSRNRGRVAGRRFGI